MVLSNPVFTENPRARRRYLRAPVPLHFPVQERVPKSTRHFRARTALYQSIELAFRGTTIVASDQFVYFDATDPKRCLAPDLAVRRGPSQLLMSWKTWELGAPEVGVEILSASDESDRQLERKLERYRQAGVLEVVVFDPDDSKQTLRLFDLFDGDLVERDPGDPEARRCDTLEAYWCVVADAVLGPTLRLARDCAGTELVLTPEEAERAEKDSALSAIQVEREQKEAALLRIQALEAELAKRA